MAFRARRWSTLALATATLLSLFVASVAQAATTTLECGLFHDYVAPDPVAPADGSITFGLSGSPEVIAADATLAPPADTNLAGLAGGVPTALTVVRDAGSITSIAFAPACTLTGDVVFVPDLFGPGADGYTVNGRLVAPVSLMGINDGLAALIPTAAANGEQLSLTFTIDMSTGTPSAFHAELSLVGAVKLKPNGDIVVGAARLPASTISDAARARLHEAHRLGVDAMVSVTGDGGPDGSAPGGVAMVITLAVSFNAPVPSASDVPDTALQPAAQPTQLPLFVPLALCLLAAVGFLAALRLGASHR